LQTKSLCHGVSFVIFEPIDYLSALTPTDSRALSGRY
jgi:hypothetical protein